MHLLEIIKSLYKHKTIISSKRRAGCDDSSSLFSQNLPFSKQLRSPCSHLPRQSGQRPRSRCPRRPVLPIPAPSLDQEPPEARALFTHLQGPTWAQRRHGNEVARSGGWGRETTAHHTLPWLRSRTGREDGDGETGETSTKSATERLAGTSVSFSVLADVAW